MILIFDYVDQTGKTTLGQSIANYLQCTYIKLKNINIDDNSKIKDNVAISTHSQIETFLQLYEKGLVGNVVLDRFHISEYVYSILFGRGTYLNYNDIEQRLLKHNDVLLIKTKTDLNVLEKRWQENEKLLNQNLLYRTMELYDTYYREITSLDMIEIDTNHSIESSLSELIRELHKRGIYPDHPRMRRATHDETMMEIAKSIAKRSPDLSRQVGAVLTQDGYIVAVAYNGPPSGMNHDKIDIRKEMGFKSGEGLEYSRSIHAEQNIIMQAGLRFKDKDNLVLYCTASPCISCTRMLIQMGIKKIYFLEKYNDKMAEKMWEEAGLEIIHWKE